MNYLYGLLALVALLLGAEQLGEYRVRNSWDKDIAVRQGVLDAEIERNKRNVADLRDQYKKDLKYAESETSKRAVTEWLRTHGLLPSCPAVQPSANSQANVPQGTDGTAGQSGTIERFAARCLSDARKVEMCAAWAAREGLPVSSGNGR